MTRSILKLDADEVWIVVEEIDLLAVLAEDLIGRAVGEPDAGRAPAGRLTAWSASPTDDDGDLVLLQHPQATVDCVLPAAILRTFHATGLAAIAARELVVPGGVTVAMLGGIQAVQPQLATIVQHVPDISHIAVCLADVRTSASVLDPRLIDRLELSGIGLSVVSSPADTVFGANLVITVSDSRAHHDLGRLTFGQVVRGTVLVNASGQDLPRALVDRVNQVYVDDLGLLPAHPDRYVVAAHQATPEPAPGASVPPDRPPRIAGDLGQLLTGTHASRGRGEDIVLVELLDAHALNVRLAFSICQTARRCGLGVHVTP